MTKFRALRVVDTSTPCNIHNMTMDELPAGEVTIKVAYSSVNYKDALAATGQGHIVRHFPLSLGIDLSGVVEKSADPKFKSGNPVIVTGYDLGTNHDGGYAEYARVPAEWVVALPQGLSLYHAMCIGTAGFTVALAIKRLEDNQQTPDQGAFIVTGATGGVGSFAVYLLATLGYEVVALSRKPDSQAYLQALGATKVMTYPDMKNDNMPLLKGQWGGGLDNVGGEVLEWLTKTVKPWGNIISIGLTAGTQLHTSVMPFILRGVSLIGVSSSNCPSHYRQDLWNRLATDLSSSAWDKFVLNTVTLEELSSVFDSLLQGENIGRIIVALDSSLE